MHLIKKFVFTYCLLIMFGFFSYSQSYKAESITAELKGKSFLGVKSAKTDDFESSFHLKKKQISFKIPLKSLSTGNDRKDVKLMESLEVEQYPYAEFTGKFKDLTPKIITFKKLN